MWRDIKLFAAVFFLISVWLSPAIAQVAEPKKAKKARKKTVSAEPKDFVVSKTLDPNGRPDVKSLLGDNMRYYVWFRDRQWFLRTTTSKYSRRFEGVISVKGGRITKCRSIGVEKKADAWKLSGDRTKLTFNLKTRKKFDGFDFRISGKDAIVQFDLKAATKPRPKQIFIGRKLQHPKRGKFSLPADPSK